MLQKLFKDKKTIALACIAATIIFAFFVERYFVSNLLSKIKSFRNQIKLQEHRLKEGLEIEAGKDKILEDYEYCKPYLEKTATSDKQAIAELLKEMERIVSESGGSITNLSPRDKPEAFDGYKTYQAEFRLEVSFEQLLKFLNKIQESSFLIRLDKFSVASKDKKAIKLEMGGVISIAIPS
ncbi:MAG: hypothetical protein GY853_14910 [PVC group bacterium]|nr:hypothetical protein [PVC group bacterium]